MLSKRIEKLVAEGIDVCHAVLIEWNNLENKEAIPTELLLETLRETPPMVPKREEFLKFLIEKPGLTVQNLQLLWYKLLPESDERKTVWELIEGKSKTLDDFQWLLMEAEYNFGKITAWRFIEKYAEEILAE